MLKSILFKERLILHNLFVDFRILSQVSRKSRQIQLSYKKCPLFSNFQVLRDSTSAAQNFYLLCLNRWQIIHFQYFVSGFVILELTKSRQWVLPTLVAKKAHSSLIRSLFKALVHLNLSLRRSWIINAVHSFCTIGSWFCFEMIWKQNQESIAAMCYH